MPIPSPDKSESETELGPEHNREGLVVGGRYRLIGLIGRGGMASVYEARHSELGRRFAVKFLNPEYANRPGFADRFRREALAAGSLEHENIVAITDFGNTSDGAPFIVMEYLDGHDLAAVLSAVGRMALGRAAGIVSQACRGLSVAHARGIVHRDLKPANLFLTERADGADLIKILDFGIAKLCAPEDFAVAKTRSGIALGTAHYMSPEQARGAKDVDQRADVYALGVILYELLTAQRPHAGETYNEILFNILTQRAPGIRDILPSIPNRVAQIVEQAMAFDRAQRFSNVSELQAALAAFTGAANADARRLNTLHVANEGGSSAAKDDPPTEDSEDAISETLQQQPVAPPVAQAQAPEVTKMTANRRLLGLGAMVAAAAFGGGAWMRDAMLQPNIEPALPKVLQGSRPPATPPMAVRKRQPLAVNPVEPKAQSSTTTPNASSPALPSATPSNAPPSHTRRRTVMPVHADAGPSRPGATEASRGIGLDPKNPYD